jgi:hypothetical protein
MGQVGELVKGAICVHEHTDANVVRLVRIVMVGLPANKLPIPRLMGNQ